MAHPLVAGALLRTAKQLLPAVLYAVALGLALAVLLGAALMPTLQATSREPIVFASVSEDGWTSPAAGPLTSPFGPRPPICGWWGCTPPFHDGQDFAGGGCGQPIYAVNAGVVEDVFLDFVGNWRVKVSHGPNLSSEYWHMLSSGILVTKGQAVVAGEPVALVGDSGASVGCHLHFVMYLDGTPIDPVAVLTERGVVF